MAALFSKSVARLSELAEGQEADFFAMLAEKEPLQTRDGKPFFRVAFRDRGRSVGVPVWNDSAWYADCQTKWSVGEFYKIRGL